MVNIRQSVDSRFWHLCIHLKIYLTRVGSYFNIYIFNIYKYKKYKNIYQYFYDPTALVFWSFCPQFFLSFLSLWKFQRPIWLQVGFNIVCMDASWFYLCPQIFNCSNCLFTFKYSRAITLFSLLPLEPCGLWRINYKQHISAFNICNKMHTCPKMLIWHFSIAFNDLLLIMMKVLRNIQKIII